MIFWSSNFFCNVPLTYLVICLYLIDLWPTKFVKGWRVNILGFEGYVVSVSPLLCCGEEPHITYTTESSWVLIKFYLQKHIWELDLTWDKVWGPRLWKMNTLQNKSAPCCDRVCAVTYPRHVYEAGHKIFCDIKHATLDLCVMSLKPMLGIEIT